MREGKRTGEGSFATNMLGVTYRRNDFILSFLAYRYASPHTQQQENPNNQC